MILSFAGFFWHGYQFELWGKYLQFRWASLGWLGWVLLAAFGGGYMTGGARDGVKGSLSVGGLLLGALIVGILLGNYR
ncbi:hypothetical protein OVA03_09100 [Asticcacaulis sp. SL142]|jgi:hypothetical protein|uniref:hypothetical protein n=1 Tax=Asticcacaulis sp. SL142 TaxID=2995155 RepID=UPI00226CCACD|nr:hypothetical protein [Asticcacaulis sp. SL142]WAC46874.1 hypothetical protein OVA03_09100 [Asticcacaulis sp. SL142]